MRRLQDADGFGQPVLGFIEFRNSLQVDAAESRLYSRLSDLDDRIESARQDITDELGEIRGDVRDAMQSRDEKPLSLD